MKDVPIFSLDINDVLKGDQIEVIQTKFNSYSVVQIFLMEINFRALVFCRINLHFHDFATLDETNRSLSI